MAVLNHVARRVLKTYIDRSAAGRDRGMKLPFSRCAPLMRPLFGGTVEATWRGARLQVDPGELEGYYRYFFPDGPDQEYEFLDKACRTAAVFFDVGANQGIYSLALAKRHAALRVVAFEPDPRLARTIQENLSLNPAVCGRVELKVAAVAAFSGSVHFRPAVGTNSGTGSISMAAVPDGIAVPAIALADYIEQTGVMPDVIKIDVEGAEVDVLRGMPLSASVQAMLVELHPHAFSADDRPRYQSELLDALHTLPLNWRFLIEESRWADTLSPGSTWAPRIHAFGTSD